LVFSRKASVSPALAFFLMTFRFALTLVLLAFATQAETPKPASAPAAQPKPRFKKLLPQTPSTHELRTLEVVAYPEHRVELQVYVPKAEGTWPCILDIHGGGWKARQIDSDKPMMERLAQRGFVTALVSYRLATEAPYPAALHDCKAALRCLRAHARELKIDPERIGCMGGSAGGHLSGLTAATSGLTDFEGEGPHRDQSSRVKAAIVMAATQDLVTANREKTNENAQLFFGGTCAEKPAVFAAASPITHVRADMPPILFIEGEKDTLKIGRAEMMEQMRTLGIETGLHTLRQAPHPFWMSDPWCAETVDLAAAWFQKHLGKPSKP
jgi:acetyl esterase/lipase